MAVGLESAMPRFSPSSDDLAVLLDAAIEIDGFSQGNPIDPQIFNVLGERLGFNREIRNAEALSQLADARGIDLFSRTVSSLSKKQTNTLDELAGEIRKFTNAFRHDLTELSPGDLEEVKNFCLALHREILAESYEFSVGPKIDPP